MTKAVLCLMAVLLAAGACFSADITTRDGKTYKDATVTSIEADGAHISFRQGVVKVPFDQLPQEIQRQYAVEAHNPVPVQLTRSVEALTGFRRILAENPMLPGVLVVLGPPGDIKLLKKEFIDSWDREKAYFNQQVLPPTAYLAISGGSDNGAFGAGFLNGWTKALDGDRAQ